MYWLNILSVLHIILSSMRLCLCVLYIFVVALMFFVYVIVWPGFFSAGVVCALAAGRFSGTSNRMCWFNEWMAEQKADWEELWMRGSREEIKEFSLEASECNSKTNLSLQAIQMRFWHLSKACERRENPLDHRQTTTTKSRCTVKHTWTHTHTRARSGENKFNIESDLICKRPTVNRD